MKKVLLFILLLFSPFIVFAQRGCCSHHGGVCGCNNNGRQVCCDGSLSPTCTCSPPRISGCTDPKANNYNPNANYNNNSCKYDIYGCRDKKAENYDPKANKDGNCIYIEGCTDKNADNYDPNAIKDNGSCRYIIKGCTDVKAENYNSSANTDDGSCSYIEGCTDSTATNYNPEASKDNGSCVYIYMDALIQKQLITILMQLEMITVVNTDMVVQILLLLIMIQKQ